ncbi:MAG: crossover junction endodeoxyribonuclease RuvC [Bryobacteraceae bacterium]
MRILGIDCGSRFTGYGVIETGSPRHRLVEAGVVRTDLRDSYPERLLVIANALREVVRRCAPDEAAVEETFQSVNAASAIKLTQVRGAVLLVLAEAGLKVGEYPPARVKLAVTGNGRADKEQVQWMVQSLLNLAQPVASFDASDALAVALCHAAVRATEVLR